MKKWISTALVFASLLGQAQYNLNDFQFQRSLEVKGDGWNRFELTPDMPGKMQPDLNDFRIYALSAEQDTMRVPFIFDVKKPKLKLEAKKLKMFNKVQSESLFKIILELIEDETYNRIDLQINNKNFDWMVQLEGSNDLKNWVARNEPMRILAINQSGANYRHTSLKFDNTRYKYLRVSIETEEDVSFRNAVVWEEKESAVSWRKLKHFDEFTYNKSDNESVINSRLEFSSPVSRIEIRGSSLNEFYRQAIIEYLADSIVLEGRVDYVYREAARVSWASGDDATFDIPTTYAKTWRIRVPHFDNEPIELEAVEYKGYGYFVLARLPKAESFNVIYGSLTSPKANFDLMKVKEEITGDLLEAVLGEEIVIPKKEVVKQSPLFENELWMWATLIVLTLFLSYLGFRMMKA